MARKRAIKMKKNEVSGENNFLLIFSTRAPIVFTVRKSVMSFTLSRTH